MRGPISAHLLGESAHSSLRFARSMRQSFEGCVAKRSHRRKLQSTVAMPFCPNGKGIKAKRCRRLALIAPPFGLNYNGLRYKWLCYENKTARWLCPYAHAITIDVSGGYDGCVGRIWQTAWTVAAPIYC